MPSRPFALRTPRAKPALAERAVAADQRRLSRGARFASLMGRDWRLIDFLAVAALDDDVRESWVIVINRDYMGNLASKLLRRLPRSVVPSRTGRAGYIRPQSQNEI